MARLGRRHPWLHRVLALPGGAACHWRLSRLSLFVGLEEFIFDSDDTLAEGKSAWFEIGRFKSAMGKKLKKGVTISRIEVFYTAQGKEKVFEHTFR